MTWPVRIRLNLSDINPANLRTSHHHASLPMRVSFGILLLTPLLHVTSALYAGRFCPLACDFTLNHATFNNTDAWLARKVRSCRSQLRVTSLYLCFAEYCEDEEEGEKWIKTESPWCDEHAGVTLPAFHDVVDQWATEDRASCKRLDADEAQSFPVLNEVVLPDARFFERAFTTMVWQTLRRINQERATKPCAGRSLLSIRSSFNIRVCCIEVVLETS
jgi:hypothetical protein